MKTVGYLRKFFFQKRNSSSSQSHPNDKRKVENVRCLFLLFVICPCLFSILSTCNFPKNSTQRDVNVLYR
jgi:hypothetical protein